MKIVLDTNCLLRAMPDKSEFNCILSALQQGRYTLCYSNDIFMEYEELLARFYPKQITGYILNFIFYSPNTLMITPYFQLKSINFPSIKVIDIETFKNILKL